MSIASKYIDIHTHHLTTDSDVIQILNHSLQDEWSQPLDKNNNKYSIGIHPYDIGVVDVEKLIVNVQENLNASCVMGIGECGLDARLAIEMDRQLEYFLYHKEWAESIHKPLTIHCVQAYHHFIPLLKNIKVPYLFHGVSVRWNVMRYWVEVGAYLSFGLALLKENPSAIQTFQNTPLDQVFLETDNADFDIKILYEKAAQIKKISLEELILQLQNNFTNFYNRT